MRWRNLTLGLVITLVLTFGTVLVYAHTGSSDSTDGIYLDWSPSTVWMSLDGQTPSEPIWHIDFPNLKWAQDRANAVRNSGHRFTAELKNMNGSTGSAIRSNQIEPTGWYATNFWSPKWDVDDDTGDGWGDEVEVTAQDPAFPASDQVFLFLTDWTDRKRPSSSGSGYIAFSGQLSDWLIEWQAKHWDEYWVPRPDYWYSYDASGNRTESTARSRQLSAGSLAQGTESAIEKAKEREVVDRAGTPESAFRYVAWREAGSKEINLDIEPGPNLDEYRVAVEQAVAALQKDGMQQVKARITFRSPVSWTDLVKLTEHYGLDVAGFEVRALDELGERWTIGGTPGGGLTLEQKVDSFARRANRSLTILGVTSIEMIINFPNQYRSLQQDQRVFLVDVLGSKIEQDLIRSSKLLEGYKIDVNHPNLYWLIEISSKTP